MNQFKPGKRIGSLLINNDHYWNYMPSLFRRNSIEAFISMDNQSIGAFSGMSFASQMEKLITPQPAPTIRMDLLPVSDYHYEETIIIWNRPSENDIPFIIINTPNPN